MEHAGGCHCGSVRYVANGDPVHAALCACTDCRRAAGAPMVGWILFAAGNVTITGDVADYASSPGTRRQFCPMCGTGLFFWNEAIFPGKVDIQQSTLDDPAALPPGACIQAADAPAWLWDMASLPRFDRYPG